jgi:cobaltochelatase CobS
VGPTGSGKTTLARQIAEALDKKFSFNSLSGGCSESHLIGRTLPNKEGEWVYKPSPFVTTYEQGGVHLFDELDGADPNMLLIVNSALANGQLSIAFEDKVVDKHADCIIIAAANTYGKGASRVYVGRNALDGATMDRFAMTTVEVGYDVSLEADLIFELLDMDKSRELMEAVSKLRSNINDATLRRALSTRSVITIAKMMSQGKKLHEVLKSFVLGWSTEEKSRLLDGTNYADEDIPFS